LAIDPTIHGMLDRREAWQFELLPICRDGELLIVATSPERLARAAAFARQRLIGPLRIILVDRTQLRAALMTHYRWDAMRTHERGSRPGQPPRPAATTDAAGDAEANAHAAAALHERSEASVAAEAQFD